MQIIHLYYREKPGKNRFFKGDRYLINFLKKLFLGKKTSGIRKVFENLCLGFKELNVNYDINLPFEQIQPGEPVVVLGSGRYALIGYNKTNPIIAGIGLMTHPSEWPDLFAEYPVANYLQHSKWANDVYIPYYGSDKCLLWPSGVDTEHWTPKINADKTIDILIYNKIRWNKEELNIELKAPILEMLGELGISYHEIVYGNYAENEYKKLLGKCKAMIFLCEHESQGFACCEALSMNVPVFAWDQGFCLDPNRFKWNDPVIPASSVPFFNENCGMRFKDLNEFENKFSDFWEAVKANKFNPRNFILDTLTLKKSAEIMLNIIKSVYK